MSSQNDLALDAHGDLKDASKINFYFDKDSSQPMSGPDAVFGPRRGGRDRKDGKFKAALDEVRDPVSAPARRNLPRRKRARKNLGGDDHPSDDDDSDFSDDGESFLSDDGSVVEISNEELADSLPSKIDMPSSKKRKSTSAKNKRVEVIMEDTPERIASRQKSVNAPALDLADGTASEKARAKARSAIHLFFEDMVNDPLTGDKVFRCRHGNKTSVTIPKTSRGNLDKLARHLKNTSAPMYRLYSILKQRDSPPTQEEIDIARGAITLPPGALVEYVAKMETISENLRLAFERQAMKAEPWDQVRWETLLAEYIAACDQPFEEVERPELIKLLQYTHRPSASGTALHIPGRKAVRSRIMKMGEEIIESTRQMFQELESKLSISLDCWTSTNQHAFIAIVAHWINNEGEAEELLIDFRELQGSHTGENMAEAVWETLVMYGIEAKLMVVMADNATNNDTLVDALAERLHAAGIHFVAKDARGRCMPHTVHLSALELLEGVGAITKEKASRANYQDDVSAPLDRSFDDDAAGADDSDDEDDPAKEFRSAIAKLRKIVKAVRVTPQRRESWLTEARASPPASLPSRSPNAAPLMLILDVRTRWSSTHQMLRRCTDYRDVVDRWVSARRDLRNLELDDEEWDAIEKLTSWLKAYRSATTQMSTTSKPMLSTTLAVFRGLQDHLKEIIRHLPSNTSPTIRDAIVSAHAKLAVYYQKFDESPYCTWASLLDPRIMYEGLRQDYAGDYDLLAHLETMKQRMQCHFDLYYASGSAADDQAGEPGPSSAGTGSPQKVNFTARYQQKDKRAVNQLEEFFKLPREDFVKCNPLHWWLSRRSTLPDVYRFMRDIFSIPGSAVAVERIFSGGRDTISMRRANLQGDTIRTLMIVKNRLHLARKAAKELSV